MAIDDAHCAAIIKSNPVGVVVRGVCCVEVPEVGSLRAYHCTVVTVKPHEKHALRRTMPMPAKALST